MQLHGKMEFFSNIFDIYTSNLSTGMGVDLLFNIPCTPNAPLYSYQAVHVPIGFRVQPGFASSTVNVECDFMGHFAAYLNQGWKLVEIFLDQGMQRHGGMVMTKSLFNTHFHLKFTIYFFFCL